MPLGWHGGTVWVCGGCAGVVRQHVVGGLWGCAPWYRCMTAGRDGLWTVSPRLYSVCGGEARGGTPGMRQGNAGVCNASPVRGCGEAGGDRVLVRAGVTTAPGRVRYRMRCCGEGAGRCRWRTRGRRRCGERGGQVPGSAAAGP